MVNGVPFTMIHPRLFHTLSPCTLQCTVYSVQCTVYSVQCTVYSVHCRGDELTAPGSGLLPRPGDFARLPKGAVLRVIWGMKMHTIR